VGGSYRGYVGGSCRSKISGGKYFSAITSGLDENDAGILGGCGFTGKGVSEAEVLPSLMISKYRGSSKLIKNSSLIVESFIIVRQSGYMAYIEHDLGCGSNIHMTQRTSIAISSSSTMEAHNWRSCRCLTIKNKGEMYYGSFWSADRNALTG
jgi:hypothetical protein